MFCLCGISSPFFLSVDGLALRVIPAVACLTVYRWAQIHAQSIGTGNRTGYFGRFVVFDVEYLSIVSSHLSPPKVSKTHMISKCWPSGVTIVTLQSKWSEALCSRVGGRLARRGHQGWITGIVDKTLFFFVSCSEHEKFEIIYLGPAANRQPGYRRGDS